MTTSFHTGTSFISLHQDDDAIIFDLNEGRFLNFAFFFHEGQSVIDLRAALWTAS